MSDNVPEAFLCVRTPYIKRSLRWNKGEHGKAKIKLPIARPRAYCEHITVMLYEWRALWRFKSPPRSLFNSLFMMITKKKPKLRITFVCRIHCQKDRKRFHVMTLFFLEYWLCYYRPLITSVLYRGDSRFAPSQWETSLQSNAVSHWLGTNTESALCIWSQRTASFRVLRICRHDHSSECLL